MTLKLTDGDSSLHFCNGNLAEGAIKNFFAKHNCNFNCRILQLKFLPSASQKESKRLLHDLFTLFLHRAGLPKLTKVPLGSMNKPKDLKPLGNC